MDYTTTADVFAYVAYEKFIEHILSTLRETAVMIDVITAV